ncbi:MAG: Cas10/Cmr2 second palm domain-containing protein [Pseudonocardiaceae bacterium]
MTSEDLVVVAVPGIQQFLTWSRSTADVAGASAIVSELVRVAAAEVMDSASLVMPSTDRTSTPNRLVITAPAGSGHKIAARVVKIINAAWATRVESIANGMSQETKTAWLAAASHASGFPMGRWVVVPPLPGGYGEQWESAQQAMNARKRIRDFPPISERQVQLCTMTGRWPAVESATLARLKVRTRRGEALSVPAVVKRRTGGGFPSTWSIATGGFRRDVIAAAGRDHDLQKAVHELRDVVAELGRHRVNTGKGRLPGLTGDAWLADVEGAWLLPESWDADGIARDHDRAAKPDASLCERGRRAAANLIIAANKASISAPTPYLAVVVQDADSMGKRLGRLPAGRSNLRSWHGVVSSALAQAATGGQHVLESKHLGRVVYAGGDDFLGLTPAATALSAVSDLNSAFVTAVGAALPGATASAATVFFHASSPLQSVLTSARDLLDEAKEAGRPGLGVAVLHRGGERSRFVRRWEADAPAPPGTAAVTRIQTLAAVMRRGLSGRLATRLEQDSRHLAELSEHWQRRELARLVWRHSGMGSAGALDAETVENVTDALLALGAADGTKSDVVTVARFAAGIECE